MHLLLSQPQRAGLASCIARLGIACVVPVAAVATIALALELVFLCITAAAMTGGAGGGGGLLLSEGTLLFFPLHLLARCTLLLFILAVVK